MTRAAPAALPFSAVVGQDEAKLALILATCEPLLGGVLLRGQKGSAKTTLARGLAALLPGDAPFVELPLGATEDRVVGSIDAAHLLTSGEVRIRPGLLAAAHTGVLYVDEINLLADHLVDALLDAAVSGRNRIERDGVSHVHDAQFVLVGSMNPEEGELRPQLLDRFGLSVAIAAPESVTDRVAAVRHQLAAERPAGESDAAGIADLRAADRELRRRVERWRLAAVPDEVVELAARVALEVGAEGLRADLMLCRAAATRAGWEGRSSATHQDLREVAPLVLAHRRRRQPFEEPGIDPTEIEHAFRAATTPRSPAPMPDREEVMAPEPELRPPVISAATRPGTATEAGSGDGRPDPAPGRRGRFVRAAEDTDEATGPIAIGATALTVATRRRVEPESTPAPADIRTAVHEDLRSHLVIVAVDASGSMGADRRIATAKAAVLGLLRDAYRQRDRVALIAFRGAGAELVLRPTGSIEVARARLVELPVGGATPLAEAIELALDVAGRGSGDLQPYVVLVTDGRATSGGTGVGDPSQNARDAATRFGRAGLGGLVVDAEGEIARLGLAFDLARRMRVDCIRLDDFSSAGLRNRLDLHGPR